MQTVDTRPFLSEWVGPGYEARFYLLGGGADSPPNFLPISKSYSVLAKNLSGHCLSLTSYLSLPVHRWKDRASYLNLLERASISIPDENLHTWVTS